MRFCQPIGGLTGQKSGAVRSNSQDDDDQITALFFYPYICILTPLHPKKAGRGCVFSNLSCGCVSGWNLRLPARVWAAVWDLRVLRTRCMYTRPEFNAATLQRTNVPLPAELNADCEASRGQQEAGRVIIEATRGAFIPLMMLSGVRPRSREPQEHSCFPLAGWLHSLRVCCDSSDGGGMFTMFRNRHCRSSWW